MKTPGAMSDTTNTPIYPPVDEYPSVMFKRLSEQPSAIYEAVSATRIATEVLVRDKGYRKDDDGEWYLFQE